MKIAIESTDKITAIHGVPCRVWRGVTGNGVECELAIAMIRVKQEDDNSAFEAELNELRPLEKAIDMRFF